jgi:hypothetical protein
VRKLCRSILKFEAGDAGAGWYLIVGWYLERIGKSWFQVYLEPPFFYHPHVGFSCDLPHFPFLSWANGQVDVGKGHKTKVPLLKNRQPGGFMACFIWLSMVKIC